jgi:hypothetical protein
MVPCPPRTCCVALLTVTTLTFCASAQTAGENASFKAVDFAILKIDERPAKTWDVYLAEKQKNLILVRLGIRYLLLDTQARQVFEVRPEAFEHKDKDLLLRLPEEKSAAEAQSSQKERREEVERPMRKLLPSDAWQIKDAGPSLIFRLKLTAEGRVLEVHLRNVPRWMRN